MVYFSKRSRHQREFFFFWGGGEGDEGSIFDDALAHEERKVL